MKNKFLFLTALSGFFCIALGAGAAHGLQKILNAQALEWIATGLQYQMFHTLALLGLGLFQIANSNQNPPACRATAFNIIGGSWALGILLFSGNLYLLAFAVPTIHWLIPVGGVSFMLGWATLAFISMRSRKQ